MSVLIKGMEMPKSCYQCQFAMQQYRTVWHGFKRVENSYACVMTHKKITSTKRNRFCPLIEIPPHGRLIDADALMPNAEYKGKYDILTAYDVVAAPTIIEAEGED